MIEHNRHRTIIQLLRLTQCIAPVLMGVYVRVFGEINRGTMPNFSSRKQYIFVSNHPTFFDAPGAFSALSFRELWSVSPIRFLTNGRIYYSFLRPLLALCGCFPTRKLSNPLYNAVEQSIDYLNAGQSIYICPEGRRVKRIEDSDPKDGVIRIINSAQPDVIIMLIHITWERVGFRPKLRVAFGECSDRTSAKVIMDQVYNL